ncbi:ABC1 kinase family protein [Rhodoferax ferrireducens]|uniref:ABC1 kinase family protein n=1 Tax=Rhodoferax ferrireducens TaxID=192843 RepID=UPI003BB6D164
MAALIDVKKCRVLRAAPRLMQIMRVFARHKFLGALFGRGHWPTPKEVRETFEELGLVFLKFGQVLALRRDLLPTAYIEELELLHDQLPAMDIDMVRATVEAELGAPLTKFFSAFGETPLAAATIAQVHEATLLNGRHVAVKVQRPCLKSIIATDIAALNSLVVLGEGFFPSLRALDLPVVVRELANSLHRETDFGREARSIVLIRAALADVPDLWIPDVIASCSGETVLTMEYSPGERVDLYAKSHPQAMPRVVNTLVKLMLHSIFEEGLFHADPHPGNVFVLPDGRLSLLDFGNTGDLDEPMRESLTLLLEAVVKGDARAATEAYLEMAPANEKVNHMALLVDIKAVLYEIRRTNLEDVSIGNAFEALLRAGSRNGVHNPGEFVLLTRAFAILESMIGLLAPGYNHMESFREEISRLTAQHFSPERIKEKTTKLAREMERLVTEAPGDTRRVLRRFAEGNLGRLPGLEAVGRRFNRNLERLTGAIAFAALVIGGSMLLMTPMGGWHDTLGNTMIISGFVGIVIIYIRALRRDPDQR